MLSLLFLIPLLLVLVTLITLCFFLLWEITAAGLSEKKISTAECGHEGIHSAILVPAHNEESVLRTTLKSLKENTENYGEILVIADNCDDSTAEIAQSENVNVLEREDKEHRGKGYALDFGIQSLMQSPPDIVIMIDADCVIQAGSIDYLKRQVLATGRPAQAVYLLEQPSTPSVKGQISAFAFKVKNFVRPLGLRQFDLGCPLTGTGMAFPWEVISTVNLASSEIVEDMKLGLDLSIAGYPPLLCPEAQVTGQLPNLTSASISQRTRWEHGHLQILSQYVFKILAHAFYKRQWGLIFIALDLAIPPLSLLVIFWLLTAAIVLFYAIITAVWFPVYLSMISGFLLLLSILIAWSSFGRQDLPIKSLLLFPFYLFWKIPLYFNFLFKPQKQWVRTERDTSKE